jgi:NAD(P)-dependent dehydrogenase (short-subunit alcohol dehydrogenase family)
LRLGLLDGGLLLADGGLGIGGRGIGHALRLRLHRLGGKVALIDAHQRRAGLHVLVVLDRNLGNIARYARRHDNGIDGYLRVIGFFQILAVGLIIMVHHAPPSTATTPTPNSTLRARPEDGPVSVVAASDIDISLHGQKGTSRTQQCTSGRWGSPPS